ncbi:MAG: hypothetical protein RIB79_02490 [Allomuricauda sp.]
MANEKIRIKYPDEKISSITLIRQINGILWVILGVIAISFIFIDEKYYESAIENFYLSCI